MKQALGIVEVSGLVFTVVCADAALKAANVELLGYEATKGDARFVLKFVGNIGAVKAAIDSAVALARKYEKDVIGYAIARPSDVCWDVVQLENEIESVKDEVVEEGESEIQEEEIKESKFEMQVETIKEAESESEEENFEEAELESQQEEVKSGVCNLCRDSKCPRHKGEPHNLCIHFDEE